METFFDDHDEHMHRLLTEVIHKIKNSLGGIGGFAALLERDLGPDDPRTNLAQRIQNGVVRMNDFVVDLML
jgi:nitrogen-specific signal transduction histidine kinase